MSDPRFTDFDPTAKRQADQTRYSGTEVQVLYDRRKCMHAAECGRASKAVFDSKRAKWIEPDEAESAEALVAIVQRCPTGALMAERHGEVIPDPIPEQNTIVVSPDGPLYARGELEISGDPDGVQTRVALCRCGASSLKPYCDNTHVRLRFKDAGGVNADGGEPSKGGKVTVTAIPQGPLMVKGPCTLQAASGRAADTGDTKYLCRCGNSKNKPYCDGAHKAEGFRSVE